MFDSASSALVGHRLGVSVIQYSPVPNYQANKLPFFPNLIYNNHCKLPLSILHISPST